jgi:paraquat-inducible protein A
MAGAIGNIVVEKSRTPFVVRKAVFVVLALLYAGAAIYSAWQVTTHTQASTKAIEQILLTYNLKNESAETLESYKKQHPILGMLLAAPVRHQLKLPSQEKADEALYSDVKDSLKTVRRESSVAAWWSWFLLSLSLLYVVTVVALERSFTARAVLFAMCTISVVFFFIGILAPAMVIWTAPSIPMETGNLEFVVQHQVRGIAAIIWELFTGGHYIIGGFLFLFSIVTPLTKATLTFVATGSHSKALNYRIGEFLHTIGKWSMADVFVAAVLLSLYALKFQEATKSIPCLGIYYFIGYCLLSLTTTELMVHSGIVAGNEKKSRREIGLGGVIGLVAGVICFVSASSLYTYQQYTENVKAKIESAASPQKLNNADLVLPVHKS